MILAALLVAALTLLLAGCGAAGGSANSPKGEEATTAATEEQAIVSGERRKVTAYVCDGKPDGLAEWFTTSVAGNGVEDLASATGQTRLDAELSGAGASGALTLDDGKRLDFEAAPVRDGAGLYEMIVSPNGERRGTSASGAKLSGRPEADGKVAYTITTPEGRTIDYEAREEAAGGGKPDTYTAIVLPGGKEQKGRGGTVKKGAPTTNFIDNHIKL